MLIPHFVIVHQTNNHGDPILLDANTQDKVVRKYHDDINQAFNHRVFEGAGKFFVTVQPRLFRKPEITIVKL